MQYVSRKAVEGALHKIFFNNAGQHIFFNSDVMKQLEQSEAEAASDYIANYDDYLKFKNEIANESR